MEVRGFEPLTSAVRGQRSTGLSYTPRSGQPSKGPRRTGLRAGHVAGRPDDHVDPVALTDRAEPVERRTRPAAHAVDDVPRDGGDRRLDPRRLPRGARRLVRLHRRAMLDREQEPDVEDEQPGEDPGQQSTPRAAAGPGRSGTSARSIRAGTRAPCGVVRGACARLRSATPTNRAPLRGVTIHRPSLPCASACAKSSILRSKSSTLCSVALPPTVRRQQERHPHDAQCREE